MDKIEKIGDEHAWLARIDKAKDQMFRQLIERVKREREKENPLHGTQVCGLCAQRVCNPLRVARRKSKLFTMACSTECDSAGRTDCKSVFIVIALHFRNDRTGPGALRFSRRVRDGASSARISRREFFLW